MKYFFSIIFLLFSFSFLSFGQVNMADTSDFPYWIEMMQDPKANFFETQKAFEKYWDGRERDKGDGWKVFKRWEYHMSSKVDRFGNKPEPDHAMMEYKKYFTSSKSQIVSADHWEEVGPIDLPYNGTGQPNGIGRLNSIGFHPNSSDKFYVGSPAGGLWKTIDGGQNWEILTDTLPTLGISSIVVDYSNPDNVYIGTGDRDGGDSQGLGFWKSTDAGSTWFSSNTGMGNKTVGKLIMNPLDSSILLAATSGGIYKSIDAGSNWVKRTSNSSHYKDIVYKPGDTSTVYATASGVFYKSTDGGNTWVNPSGTGLPSSNRLVIGVTPANNDYVYLVLTNSRTYKGTYLSTNSGSTFTLKSSTPNIMDYNYQGTGTSGQAWYDLDVAVDRTNSSIIYVGGVNIFKSTDYGVNWTCVAHWVGGSNNGGTPSIHADQHVFEISPINNRMYVGNDGGLYYTSNSGASWTDISDGMGIAQIYKIGQSAQSQQLVINGYQDNGTAIFDGNWRTEIGGDGMECIVDPTDSNYMYGSLYYGDIRRSTNYGGWFSKISNGVSETGEWVTPFILQEGNSSVMLAGYKNIWRASNVKAGSVSWTQISSALGGSNLQGIRVLENSPADNDVLYFAREDDKFFRSDDINNAAPTYTDLTSNLPTSTWPKDIEAHPFDVNKVYVVVSNRVYESSNKGVSWTNISGSLPNIAMNCIVFDSSTTGDLYVGSELGVFYKKAGTNTAWIPFNGGMSNAIDVRELEIYYDADRTKSRIKAATYGRGLWTSQLYETPQAAFDVTDSIACITQEIQFHDLSVGFYHSLLWTFPGGSPSTSNQPNPKVTYATPGIYNVTLKIWNDYENSTAFKQHYLTIDSIPNISVSPASATIRRGDTVVLTASGGTKYSWTPTYNLNNTAKAVIKVFPDSTTTYTVLGMNSYCDSIGGQAQSVITINTSGIDDNGFDNGLISVYPNPVKDILKIDFNQVDPGRKNLKIMDASGRLIHEQIITITSTSDSYELDVNSYERGIYFLHLEGQKVSRIVKFYVDPSF